MTELEAMWKFCHHNKDNIKASYQVGCFYCLNVYPAAEVDEYVSDNTALCPKCGIDAVLPDVAIPNLSVSFLGEMFKYYFVTLQHV